MTSTVNEFLSGYGVSAPLLKHAVPDLVNHDFVNGLEHALESGAVVKKDAPKGNGKGGGRKFDESKVKRDGSGQFARTASARRPDDEFRSPEQMDAEFLKNIDDNKALQDAANKAKLYKKSVDILKGVKKASGLSVKQLMEFDKPKAPPAAVKAMTSYFNQLASTYNSFLSRSPAAVSPSGKQRIMIRVLNPGTPQMDIVEVLVPNTIKHDGMTSESFLSSILDHESLSHAAGWKKVLELFGLDVDDLSDEFDDSDDENDEN